MIGGWHYERAMQPCQPPARGGVILLARTACRGGNSSLISGCRPYSMWLDAIRFMLRDWAFLPQAVRSIARRAIRHSRRGGQPFNLVARRLQPGSDPTRDVTQSLKGLLRFGWARHAHNMTETRCPILRSHIRTNAEYVA